MDKATERLLRDYRLWWRSTGRSTRTIDEYERHLVRYVAAGYELPPQLREAREYVVMARDEGRGGQWLHWCTRALKSMASWWAEEEDEPNALIRLKYPRLDVPAPGRIAKDVDVEALLASLKGRDFRTVRDRAIITLLLDSGLRRSELARMRLSDVDHDLGAILLPKTKSSKGRRIPISARAGTALRRYERLRSLHPGHALDAYWLNFRYRSALRSDSITRLLADRSEAAGVDISSHMFRRRFASEWAKRGGTDDALGIVAGWADGRMIARYRAGDAEELAAQQFARIIDGGR